MLSSACRLGGTARGLAVVSRSREQEPKDLSGGLTARQACRRGKARENHIYSLSSIKPELPASETVNPRGTPSFAMLCIYFYKSAACCSGASVDSALGIDS